MQIGQGNISSAVVVYALREWTKRKGATAMNWLRMGLTMCVCVSMWWWGADTVAHAATDPLTDQQAAMHTSTRGDVAAHADAPLYQIVGTVNPSKRTWQATQTLTFRNRSGVALNKLYFRLVANLPAVGGTIVISTATVNGKMTPVKLESKRFLARLDVATPIAPDALVTVVLQFVTTAPNNGGTKLYGTLNYDGQTLALATAYPQLAMLNNGQWDTTIPDSKGDLVTSPVSFYDVTTTLPRTHALVSTGTAVSTSIVRKNQTIRVVSGLQRDFTLAATKLASVTATVDGTLLRVYYPKGKLKAGQVTLNYASQAMRFFNQSYGQYPYNELDLITVNAGTFEGIEFPGMLLFEQRRYNTSADFESLVVHEVAHQWFYGVVGNDVQNHAWVDEGFATYSQVLYLESVRGAKAGAAEKSMFVDDYNYLKSQKADGSMDRPIRTMDEDQYGILSYSKAALYLDAIRNQVGTPTFLAAVRSYVSTNRYALVDGSAFVQAVNNSCGCTVQPLFTRWVLAK
jgi:hypothetical protein